MEERSIYKLNFQRLKLKTKWLSNETWMVILNGYLKQAKIRILFKGIKIILKFIGELLGSGVTFRNFFGRSELNL